MWSTHKYLERIRLSDVLNASDSSLLESMDNTNLNHYTKDMTLSEFTNLCQSDTSEKWDLYVI